MHAIRRIDRLNVLRRKPLWAERDSDTVAADAPVISMSRRLRRKTLLVSLLASVTIAMTFPAVEAASGEIITESIESPSLGRAIPARIYVPKWPPADCWRLLLLLHGLGGNETDWETLGNIKTTMDRMIVENQIVPLLVVMPGAGNSWYVDSEDIGGEGNLRTALIEDLLPAIRKRYPVCSGRSKTAIAGLSMGGYGALHLALSYPGVFAAAASLSGAIWQNVPEEELDLPPEEITRLANTGYFHRSVDHEVTAGVVLPKPGTHYSGVFGVPFDARRFNRLNPFTLLDQLAQNGTKPPALFLTVGDDDSHQLWQGNIAFFDTARYNEIPIEFRITDGDHVWALWKRSIVDALLFIDAALDQAAALE